MPHTLDHAHVTITPEPVVRLANYFQEPYNLAVATARTCYSSRVIDPADVDKDEQARAQRDRIAESTYKAGHHTTIQHPTFQFVLERVSRQFLWSFLHAHPFYNCLAGETEIPHFHVANKAPWTIAELYQRFHSSDKHTYVKKMHIRSVDHNGDLVPNRIRNVVATGRRPVFRLQTALGYIIRATRDHRFMREDRSWARVHELSVGDVILVNGLRFYKDRQWLKQRYHDEGLSHRAIAVLASTTPDTIRAWIRRHKLQKPLGSWSRGVSPPNKGQTKDIYDNSQENIAILCSLCHKAAESPHRSIMRVTVDRIVSMEADGEAETYDLVMEAPFHNFVANGFIVHNSEQVSQRYVEVKPGNVVTPPLDEPSRCIYHKAVDEQMEAYHRLISLVEPAVAREYSRLFPARNLEEKRWASAIRKRAQEVARYVLPVATHAHLYHTISGVTLHRYWRLCRQFDAPLEQRLVIQRMVEEVAKIDPDFMHLAEEPIPLEETLEYQAFERSRQERHNGADRLFLEEFDRGLGGATSKLVDHSAHAAESMAQGVRSVLGLRKAELPDEQAIALVLDPAQNPYLSQTLSLTTMSKLSRAMVHPHFTFKKKLSHTADSQDQRHRMVPGSRPILASHFIADRPDYILPPLIAESAEAESLYRDIMARSWEAIGALLSQGVGEEFALYLLPNAFPIRFEESGDLLHFHHKWVQRLCYTAQEEIWRACRDEVLQVKALFPVIGRYIQAPCWPRARAGIRPHCPEGDRFCGVAVWKEPIEAYRRLI